MNRTTFESDAVILDLLGPVVASLDKDDARVRDAFGRLTFLAVQLRNASVLPDIAPEHLSALKDLLAIVPRQAPSMQSGSMPSEWLQLASLAELNEWAPLARIVVDGISRCSGAHEELLAICDCQRGRLARACGELEDATLFYQSAIRRARTVVGGDAFIRAHCGMANVFMDLGNFPKAEQHFRKALRRDDGAARESRVYAWMGLALVRRKRSDFLDAMLAAWNAFDLTIETSPLRCDLLISLAEYALAYGDHVAAINGFQRALERSYSTRLTVAARTGIVMSMTRRLLELKAHHEISVAEVVSGERDLLTTIDDLTCLLSAELAPQQHAFALVACLEASAALGIASQLNRQVLVEQWLSALRSLVERFSFHEYGFRLDELIPRLYFQSEVGLAPSTRSVQASSISHARPASLARLATFASSEKSLNGAR
jgi:tetratricopeptide (TPR) repeat protein